MLPALILGHLRQHLYGEKRKRNILLIFVSLAAYRISLHSFKEPRKNVVLKKIKPPSCILFENVRSFQIPFFATFYNSYQKKHNNNAQ